MLLKTGMKLPNGTILQYAKKQFGPESTVGKLEISDGGTRWFISPNNSGWRIRPNSQSDWDRYELGSEGDYTLAKLHENKNKSALDLLKEYRAIVAEASKKKKEEDEECPECGKKLKEGECPSCDRKSAKYRKDWYKRVNEGTFEDEGGKDCCELCGERVADPYKHRCDLIAGSTKREAEYDKKKKVEEGWFNEESPVFNAVMRRLEYSHPEVFSQYGYDVVQDAVQDVASFAGKVEEIGSSDVSSWTRQVMDELKRNELGAGVS